MLWFLLGALAGLLIGAGAAYWWIASSFVALWR